MEDIELDEIVIEEMEEREDLDQEETTFAVIQHSKCTQRFHSIFLSLSTPITMWIFFTVCNFLNYIDRGAVAGALSAIEEDFELTDTEAGMLGGLYHSYLEFP